MAADSVAAPVAAESIAPQMPTQMQVQANGVTLDVEDRGERGAPPLLLIMGLGMPAAAWPEALVTRLVEAGLRVITFDNRDAGRSSKLRSARTPNLPLQIARALLRLPVRAPYVLDDMARDAAALLAALGIERAHVVGASMGGMIAQVLAAQHPGRVLSLTSIMSSTGNPSPRVALGKGRALRAIVQRPRSATDVQQVTEHLMHVFDVIGSPGYPAEPRALRAHLTRVAERGYDPAGSARQMLAILATGDRRPLLARIVAPTLVIHGRDDPLLPVAGGEETARHIRGAKLKVIDGMGHDFPDALLPELTEAIVEHVRGATATAPLALRT